jgi:hypothetical protein
MNLMTTSHDEQPDTPPNTYNIPYEIIPNDSLSSNAEANLPTSVSDAITSASVNLTSPATTPSHSSFQPIPSQLTDLSMTTFYHYDKSGYLQTTSADDPLAQQRLDYLEANRYSQRGDVVGAYLAQRDMTYPAYANSEGRVPVDEATYAHRLESHVNWQKSDIRHQNVEDNESYRYRYNAHNGHVMNAGYIGFLSLPTQYHLYSDPEAIRHLHTLQSLLPHIDPRRKCSSFQGPAIDVVEQVTGTILAESVPKKLLVLFIGRKKVIQLIKTVWRQNKGHSNHRIKTQEMCIPQGISSVSALKILLSWMKRACQYHSMDEVREFKVPRNTFAACTLAQTLTFFGLHKDAYRVDSVIARDHFKRPIFAGELEALWNCLGEESRYTYAAIKTVGSRLQAYEAGASASVSMWEEILQLMDKYPTLKARVQDLEFNETYRPVFNTEWGKVSEHSSPPERHSDEY